MTVSRFDTAAARQALSHLTDLRQVETADFATARQIAWAATAIAAELDPVAAASLFSADANDPLALRLPAGPGQSVVENLHRWLPAAASYDRNWFEDELTALRNRAVGRSPRD
jgi:hypothetical protein